MSKLLIDRIRKNREFRKSIDDPKSGRTWTFVCQRPTRQDADELARGGITPCGITQRFVVGWEGVTEDDVAGNANAGAAEWDVILWREWCADRKDFWGPCAKHLDGAGTQEERDACKECAPLMNAILGAYKDYASEMDGAVKNSQPGLSNAT